MKHTLPPLLLLALLLSLLLSACRSPAPQEIIPPETTLHAIENDEGRQVFLSALLSQIDSQGEILPEGERYAAWFARRQNYRVEPWEEDSVAWCVCFLYWGIGQCEDHLDFDFDDPMIRTADVDLFFASFTGEHWKTEDPLPGDIAFFDTDPADEDPTVNHAGAVLEVTGDTIYIIEGNALRGERYPTGVAAVREYEKNDPSILGYGALDWK